MTGEAQTAIREPDALKALEFPTLDDWRKIKTEVMPNNFLADWVSVTIDGCTAGSIPKILCPTSS